MNQSEYILKLEMKHMDFKKSVAAAAVVLELAINSKRELEPFDYNVIMDIVKDMLDKALEE